MKSRFIILLFTFFVSLSAAAEVIIVSNPPPIREVIYPPGGYSACYTVGAGFRHGYWVPEHRVCEYGNGPYGNVWISGYWQCVRYQPYENFCRGWAWVPSHWAVVNDYEYRRPWHVVYAPYHPVFYPAYYRHEYYGHHHWYR